MKQIKKVFLISLALLILSSCSNDDGYSLDKYIVELGTIEGVPGNYSITTDAGKRLFPSANDDVFFSISNKRVWVNYTILADGNRSGIDYFVRINDLTDVLTKEIISQTPQNVDSIGTDGLVIDDAWISNHYLNVSFSYEGSPWTVHYVNFVKDLNEPTLNDGTLLFEIKHNKNGDVYTTPLLKGFASFNLRKLQNGETGTVTFHIRAKGLTGDYNYNSRAVYQW